MSPRPFRRFALCAAIGTDGRVLRGGHSWLLVQPRAFTEVLENLVLVQAAEHERHGHRQPFLDQLTDVLLADERSAEIAVQRAV